MQIQQIPNASMQMSGSAPSVKSHPDSALATYQKTPKSDGSVSKVSTDFDALMKKSDVFDKQNFDL